MGRKILLGIALLLLLLSLIVLHQMRDDASMLLVNGVVYTVSSANGADDKKPVAEAIAIRGTTIVGVGTTEEITSSFTSSNVVDLGGRAAYPGFIDSHAHIELFGAFLKNLDLTRTNSVREIQDLVAERAATSQGEEWIRGRGWDQNKWKTKAFPTREMLDAVARDIPVYLVRVDAHAVWVNTKVLEITGITGKTLDPEGGKIVRDKTGKPTGVFVDNAVDLLINFLPSASEQERTAAIELAIQECLKVGLTEVHDMGVDLDGIEIYKKLFHAKKFPFRVYVAIDGPGETWDHYLSLGPDIGAYGNRLTVRAIKLYADGALGSRGAALIEPYSDEPEGRGLTVTSSEAIRSTILQALEKGFQVCVHAIGDRANHIVLNAYEEACNSKQINPNDVRLRVEHAQVIERSDIPRFAQLGVLPVMQPTHCTSDMHWAEERLGPARVVGAYAWHSLREHGSLIAGGSDFPVESPNPLWGFYAAITRQDHSGWPEGGWHPEQRMTREDALRAFTLWSAYAAFQDHLKGSIEPGKLADIVVLSNDIMKIEPREILSTTVELTMIDGEVVYSSGVVVARTQDELAGTLK